MVRGHSRDVIGPPSGLRSYLLPGERILWSGKPRQGIRFQTTDIFMVPFSLMWGGFAIFWNYSVWQTGAPDFFTIWGLPFLIIGIYLIFGRFLHDAYIRARQEYAVTDQRVLVYNAGWGQSVKSHEIDALPALDLKERGNGHGTISFETSSSVFDVFGGGNSWTIWVPTFGSSLRFVDIADVRKVYELIRRQIGRR